MNDQENQNDQSFTLPNPNQIDLNLREALYKKIKTILINPHDSACINELEELKETLGLT